MLAPEGEYYNYTGCGNTLNCNHPVVRRFIVDCLRYWVEAMHVDGFRFDLASIMTRAHSEWDNVPTDRPGKLPPHGKHLPRYSSLASASVLKLQKVARCEERPWSLRW